MCTLAWGTQATSLWACFNRDEQRKRAGAERPRLYDGPHGPLAFAKDPDGGGTWFAVSAKGFAVALLNYYPPDGSHPPVGSKSRGLLVKELAGLPSAKAAAQAAGADLGVYSPFHLFILSPSEATAFTWNGNEESRLEPVPRFWTTSSFEAEAVCAWRQREWDRSTKRLKDPADAGERLRETFPPKPAYGFTMDREDARTRSQILLQMSGAGFVFTYRSREATGRGYDEPLTVQYPD